MPRAEEDTSPRGLPPGAEQQLVEQGMQNASATPVEPLSSPFMQPQLPQAPPVEKMPPPEQEIPNIDPENGWNYDSILQAPTDRPGEPVTAGITQAPPKVSDVLRQLAASVDSPDIAALFDHAQSMGL